MGLFDIVVGGIESFISTISKVGEILQVVANMLTSICRELGLLPPEIQEEELGDCAIQAEEEGITPDKFDTYQEYVQAIQDFDIDPEKSAEISPEEKLAKALEVEANLLHHEKPEIAVTACLGLIAGHTDYFTPEKVEAIGKMLITTSNLVTNIANVVEKKEMNPDKISVAFETLADIEKQIEPGISDDEALTRAMKIEAL